MSVCMSAVSAGISEVLIKYTGNVWLQMIIITLYGEKKKSKLR